MNDPQIFNVYVDESGDEGFTIKDGEWKSSKWFLMGALIVRSTNDARLATAIDEMKKAFKWNPKQPIHFAKLSHERRKFAINSIVQKSYFRCIYVGIYKPDLHEDSPLKAKGRLYRYCTRYLLERITWFAAEYGGKANIIFENRSNTSYEDLDNYIKLLIDRDDNQIHKDRIISYSVAPKNQYKNLQVADCITSALFQALEPGNLGLPDDSYFLPLKPFIYHRKGNYSSYGLKFFPTSCDDHEFKTKYGWIRYITDSPHVMI